jgi:hypothetical protein
MDMWDAYLNTRNYVHRIWPDWSLGQCAFYALSCLDKHLAEELSGTALNPVEGDEVCLDAFETTIKVRWRQEEVA